MKITEADVLFDAVTTGLRQRGWTHTPPDRWTRSDTQISIEVGTARGEVTLRVADNTDGRNAVWLGHLRITRTEQVLPGALAQIARWVQDEWSRQDES